MSLDKNKTVAEIGRRTRLRNHEVQRMLEALIEVWTEALASGGRIEIISGIPAGAVIATKGAFLLKAEFGKGEAEH